MSSAMVAVRWEDERPLHRRDCDPGEFTRPLIPSPLSHPVRSLGDLLPRPLMVWPMASRSAPPTLELGGTIFIMFDNFMNGPHSADGLMEAGLAR